MLGWAIVGAVNAAMIAVAVRARRRAGPRRSLGRLIYGCAALMVAMGAAGVIWGLGRTIAAVSTASLDPSQKARVLAEGIADTMNLMALSLSLFAIPAIVSFVLYLMAPKEGRAHDAAPR